MKHYKQLLQTIRKTDNSNKVSQILNPQTKLVTTQKIQIQQQTFIKEFIREKDIQGQDYQKKCMQLMQQINQLKKQIQINKQSMKKQVETLKYKIQQKQYQLKQVNSLLDESLNQRDQLLQQLQSKRVQIKSLQLCFENKIQKLKRLSQKQQLQSYQTFKIRQPNRPLQQNFMNLSTNFKNHNFQFINLTGTVSTQTDDLLQPKVMKFIEVCRQERMTKRLENGIKHFIVNILGQSKVIQPVGEFKQTFNIQSSSRSDKQHLLNLSYRVPVLPERQNSILLESINGSGRSKSRKKIFHPL